MINLKKDTHLNRLSFTQNCLSNSMIYYCIRINVVRKICNIIYETLSFLYIKMNEIRWMQYLLTIFIYLLLFETMYFSSILITNVVQHLHTICLTDRCLNVKSFAWILLLYRNSPRARLWSRKLLYWKLRRTSIYFKQRV